MGSARSGRCLRARWHELAAARTRTGRPIAVNLIQPLVGRRHWEVAAAADVIVTHWGRPRRRTPGAWIHQCGSVAEALAAHAAGADDHRPGSRPAAAARCCLHVNCSNAFRPELPGAFPVLIAGGLANAADVRAALDSGAAAAVLGTRFLMTAESRAHAGYKARLVEGRETLLTDLFGFGWPAPTACCRTPPPAAGWAAISAARGASGVDRISRPPGRLPLPAEPPARESGFRS